MSIPDRLVRGVTVECMHARARHEHGTRNAYVLDKCGCAPCCEANTAYDSARHRQRKLARAAGQDVSTLVLAEPARAHARTLLNSGMTYTRLAMAAGINKSTLTGLLSGASGRPPKRRITPEVSRRLLAVKPDPTPPARPEPVVPVHDVSVGARRRVRALVALGFPITSVTAALCLPRIEVLGLLFGEGPVKPGRAQVIESLYAAWENQVPRGCREGSSPEAKATFEGARALAVAQGWTAPAGWEDGAIDDPRAEPLDGGRGRRGGRPGIALDDVEHLLDWGVPASQIAEALSVAHETLAAACRRAGRVDLLRRLDRTQPVAA